MSPAHRQTETWPEEPRWTVVRASGRKRGFCVWATAGGVSVRAARSRRGARASALWGLLAPVRLAQHAM